MNHNAEGLATLTRPAPGVHDADASGTAVVITIGHLIPLPPFVWLPRAIREPLD